MWLLGIKKKYEGMKKSVKNVTERSAAIKTRKYEI